MNHSDYIIAVSRNSVGAGVAQALTHTFALQTDEPFADLIARLDEIEVAEREQEPA